MGYSPRIQQFRDFLIKEIPRVPNDKKSLIELESLSTINLILAFVTWRMRLIPQKPRKVTLWSGGVTPYQFQVAKPKLYQFLQKVEAGDDLESHLSSSVKTKGIILQRSQPKNRRKDIDNVLARYGLHHFHVGAKRKGNPKGRSNELVFAEVLEDEFRIIVISDHDAFKLGTHQHRRLLQTCVSYAAKDIQPGQGFMLNPILSSGHSLIVNLFAIKCEEAMRRIDPHLDDSLFVDKLYNEHNIRVNRERVLKPHEPRLKWYFEDLKFGILDESTRAFFCFYPFFSR